MPQRGAIWLAAAAWIAVSACSDGPRRIYQACDDPGDCETGVCYHSRCAKPCKMDTECGEQLCLDGVCQPASTPCEDGNPCTVGKWQQGKCNTNAGQRDCSKWTSECGLGTCNSKAAPGTEPCVANTLPEKLDAACMIAEHKSKTWACAVGGPTQNGCACGLWQGAIAGPYDDAAKAVDGNDVLNGAAAAGGGVLAVGSTQQNTLAPHEGWVVRMGAAGQVLVSMTVSAPGITDGRLQRVATAASGGWLAVGRAGTPSAGWLQRLSGEQRDDKGVWHISTGWTKTIKPAGSQQGELLDVAALAQGQWAAVGRAYDGTAAGKPWLVLVNDAGQLVAEKSPPTPTGVVGGALSAVAATEAGFLVAGAGATATGVDTWVAHLDPAGQTVAQKVIQPDNAKSGVLAGITASSGGGGAAFGGLTAADGRHLGWIVRFGADLQPLWQQQLAPADSQLASWSAGAALADGSFHAVGTFVSAGSQETTAWAANVGEKTSAFSTGLAGSNLGAVVVTPNAFVLVGAITAAVAQKRQNGGWMMRFARTPKDAEPGNAKTCDIVP